MSWFEDTAEAVRGEHIPDAGEKVEQVSVKDIESILGFVQLAVKNKHHPEIMAESIHKLIYGEKVSNSIPLEE